MRKKISSLMMGFCILAVGSEACAAPLTWQNSIQEAAQHNPDLAAAQEAVRKSQAQYKGSFSPLLPQLSATARYTESKSGVRLRDYVAELSASQSLFSGFKNQSGVRKSKADLEASEENLVVVKSQVSFDLKNAYAQLLFAQQQAQLAEAIASRRQENVRLIELRFEGGREPKGSYLRSRAQYHQADFEVSQAQRALRVAQRRMARVLGRAESDRILVNDLQVGPPGPAPDFRARALETPTRLQAAAQLRSAQAGVGVARSELFPDISAVGSIGREGNHFPPRQDSWTAGIVFSYPFWPGGQNIFDLQAAQAEARRSRELLRISEDQAVLNLEQTFAAFEDAVQRVGIQQEFLEAARMRAEIARGQYTLGLLSFQDWDTIENDLISAQKTMLVDLRDAVIAEAAWEQAQGKGYIP